MMNQLINVLLGWENDFVRSNFDFCTINKQIQTCNFLYPNLTGLFVLCIQISVFKLFYKGVCG